MLIKPFPHGKGSGVPAIKYLTRLDYHGRNKSPPVVLRGDPKLTRELIDSIDREWKFTAGVCSWGPEDEVTPEDEIEVMNKFEQLAFAGMGPDQYAILWVRHSHAGHHELHFVIPRMELLTGKAFNAFPPGWEKDFGPLRDLLNVEHGWTRPDNPERARMFAPSNADIIEARLTRWGRNPTKAEKEKIRDAINGYIKQRIDIGIVQDRAGILSALREVGLEINREAKDFITVKEPESGQKIRLKGGVYGTEWRSKQVHGQADSADKGRESGIPGEVRSGTSEIERELHERIEKRTRYNRSRYQQGDHRHPDPDQEPEQNPERCLRQGMAEDSPSDNSHTFGDCANLMVCAGRADTSQVPGTGEAAADQGGDSLPERDLVTTGEEDVWTYFERDRRGEVYRSASWDQNPDRLDNGGERCDQTGVNDENRAGNNCPADSQTDRAADPAGAELDAETDPGAGEATGRIQSAIATFERVVQKLATACRAVEQYFTRKGPALKRGHEATNDDYSR